MKLITEWNNCQFISETGQDDKILEDLNESIKENKEVYFRKHDEKDENNHSFLYIPTYF